MRPNLRSKALVAAWLDFLPDPQRRIAEPLRAAVRAVEPALMETIKWGNLVFVLDGTVLLGIAPRKTHVSFQCFHLPAASGCTHTAHPLERPSGGPQRGGRFLHLRHGEPIDVDAVSALVRQAVAQARETVG